MTVRFRSDMVVELVKHSAADADVVLAARVSTQGARAGAATDAQKDAGLIGYLMRDRHGSPFEHSVFTFYVEAPIFVWREHMRHRIASYNEESGRYKVLEPVFYLPGADRNLVQTGKPGAYEFVPGTPDQYRRLVERSTRVCEVAYAAYRESLDDGLAREVARMDLPVRLYSAAFVTMNARALMNFLSLRVKSDAATFPSFPQREIELVAEAYEREFARLMPVTHAAFVRGGRVAP
ncbi:FAD-dependent thymidylate synthase [Spirilliplanes yamanashiensis]|uniref:Flavin-dependent thymidylate synthase n=1 Tax=Spirilliplanes yamanashiensis TaxID=42233 RepID=A0A8J4DFX4_9ACTN|nr:FAD-dependent thymidylate synthase [Spirilliplanes yamanashiensis]MDP9814227.1 thymidylate synthase (FAD) [Spirilliplanes yamanashiensis]GIJ00791.1 flavin-dependent thymidylate synthase [Spirilliplanes yamanashiensis]